MPRFLEGMPRFATLVSIGAVVLFVFTAVAAVSTDLGRHPRIASVLLLASPVALLAALFLVGRKPRQRGRR